MRSTWKLPSLNCHFFRLAFLNKLQNGEYIRIWAKGPRIFSDLSDKNLYVYNGIKFVEVSVYVNMLGSYLGSYVLCKRITAVIHSKTKKNKRGRLNKNKKKG